MYLILMLCFEIFGYLDFSKIGDNYCFQIDPTGEGNDRIFPIIDLSNIKKGESYENKENIKRFSKI